MNKREFPSALLSERGDGSGGYIFVALLVLAIAYGIWTIKDPASTKYDVRRTLADSMNECHKFHSPEDAQADIVHRLVKNTMAGEAYVEEPTLKGKYPSGILPDADFRALLKNAVDTGGAKAKTLAIFDRRDIKVDITTTASGRLHCVVNMEYTLPVQFPFSNKIIQHRTTSSYTADIHPGDK
ncbi:MAG: hypothetical protein GMKNLPBB_02617 [Myxococcota bacterium]|nr:hypothetical protein [Myxococcota bacterium]